MSRHRRITAPGSGAAGDGTGYPGDMTRGEYGMGWFVGERAGQRLLSHSGSTLGFLSELALWPDADLGLVVLTNGGAGSAILPFAIEQHLLELVFNEPPTAEAIVAQFAAVAAAQFAAVNARVAPVDPAAVEPYLGHYEHPALGGAELRLRDGRLIFDTGETSSELQRLTGNADPLPRYISIDAPSTLAFAWIVLRPGDDGRPELVLSGPPLPGTDPVTEVFTARPSPPSLPAATPAP